MQPYFCAYLGYYQLMQAVDKFVIYDNVQYTKSGWINRNRILINHRPYLFTIPVKHGHSKQKIIEFDLASNSLVERNLILKRIANAYRNAPYFTQTFPLVQRLFLRDTHNLFDFIYHSIVELVKYLRIKTEIIISSQLKIDHTTKAQEKVLAICKQLNTDAYINPIGGRQLYKKDTFRQSNIDLKFLQPKNINYRQFGKEFVPSLSVIDVLMFNELNKIHDFLNTYILTE